MNNVQRLIFTIIAILAALELGLVGKVPAIISFAFGQATANEQRRNATGFYNPSPVANQQGNTQPIANAQQQGVVTL